MTRKNIITAWGLTLCLLSLASGAILNVPGSYQSIQGAIDASSNGDTVIVAQGTYNENINFNGKAITVRSSDPSNPNVVANTIIAGGSGSGGGDGGGGGGGIPTVNFIYDIDGDNHVNLGDYMVFRDAWDTCLGDPNWDERVDFNKDDCIDLGDYYWLRLNWDKYADDPNIVYPDIEQTPPAVEPPPDVEQPSAATESLVVFESGENSDSVIDGFTLQGGLGRNENDDTFGGAVLFYNAGGTIRNCVIKNCSVTSKGGAIYCQNTVGQTTFKLTVIKCTITGNQAVRMGGGICSLNTPVIIEDCLFTDNYCSGVGGYGGALCLWNVDNSRVTRTIFHQNRATTRGAGIACYQSQLNVTDSRFTANDGGYGGGLYFNACKSSTIITNSIINGNSAMYGGGVFCKSSSYPKISNCILAGNNSTNSDGGGLLCITDSSAVVRNSVFLHNRPEQIQAISSEPKITFCLVENGWGDGHDYNLDPNLQDPNIECFVSMGSLDPNEVWQEVDFEADPDAYHLTSNSYCIDGGDPNYPADSYTDIDLHPRFCGSAPDIGIDETNPNKRVYNDTQQSWHSSIQSALGQANPNDEIIVNPGPYNENINLSGGVTLRSRHPDNIDFVTGTIIDGQNSGSVVTFDPSQEPNCVIDGFTITGGNAPLGGGILCNNANSTIRHCVITENYADLGGGIGCDSAVTSVSQCTIKNNNAGQYGGAVAAVNSDLELNNCSLVTNTAGVNAGCLYFNGNSTSDIDFCTIKNNNSYAFYFDSSGWANISNTILWNNQVDDPNDPNQIFSAPGGTVILNYCDIQNGWGGLGRDNIDSDPNFVGYMNIGNIKDPNDDIWVEHDFQLKIISSCANAGDPNYIEEPNEPDLDGGERFVRCRVDIGAYEIPNPVLKALANVINNTTQSEYYCSIQDALDEADTGDKIIVSQGVYRENVIIGTDNITLQSTTPGDPNVVNATIIDGNYFDSAADPNKSAYASTITLPPDMADGVTIDGLTIRGGLGFLDDANTPGDPSDDLYKGGGIFSGFNDNLSIANCNITANSAELGGGICLQANNNPAIEYCTVSKNQCLTDPLVSGLGGGIFLLDCNDVRIDNNFIVDNDASHSGAGIYGANVGRLDLNFCTIAQNYLENNSFGGGIALLDNCRDITVSNIIVWSNDPNQIYIDDPNELSLTYSDVQGGWGDPNDQNISVDPLFIDPGQGDFHLQVSSPCIDSGDPNYIYSPGVDFDIDGQSRKDGDSVDIGADEIIRVNP